jgi:two-component system response regulator RegA
MAYLPLGQFGLRALSGFEHLPARGCRGRARRHTLRHMTTCGAVLVVEDDADVRSSARIALSSFVARVDLLASVNTLDDTLAAVPYEVVLLDMNFVTGERSGAAGLIALARVQAFDPTLAVVLMTAYGGVSLAVEALKKGAVDFVLKPWRNDKLVAAVTAAAAITRSRREADNQPLDALERAAIERALARHEGNISCAALALGLSRAALYRRMSKYGL